jgi:glycosyltransferase involved in cell wall biosynthesis
MVMEGLGVVLLEAMSHGVPVIGSNVGGIPDIITDGENGFIFPCEDDRLLAEKIMVLLEDSFLKEQFRIAGYRTVRIKFSWEIISRKFSDIYRELLKQYSWGGSA